MKYYKNIDKQLRSIAFPLPVNMFMIVVSNTAMRLILRFVRDKKHLKVEKHEIVGYNEMKIKVEVFEPINSGANMPCLIYYHGGGFNYEPVSAEKAMALTYAREANCKLIIPYYHLAPKHKYPAAVQDCIACYKWVLNNAENLGIDKTKIGVTGDSAGGNLAAVITNLSKSLNLPLPKLQMLIYPVVDGNKTTESKKLYKFSPVWNSRNNEKMYRYYTEKNEDILREEISPINSKFDFEIPNTYIESTEFDCLNSEDISYAKKLKENGATVVLNETKGTFHGYDAVLKADISKRNMKKRIEFLKQNFN